MPHSPRMNWIGLCVVSALVGASVVLVNAGNLTPPSGPIVPTMHTLDDLYASVQSSPSPCPACTWQYKFLEGFNGSNGFEYQIVDGPGVLHGLWLDFAA